MGNLTPLPGGQWAQLPPEAQATTPILTCLHCGATKPEPTGEMSSADDLCSCWIRIEDMAPADIKALFAGDGTFNVGADGRLTIAELLEAER